MTSGMYQHPDYVVFLKRAGFRVALVTTESPYDIGPELLLARYADAVFTCERTCVPVFQTVCDTVRYLPHAWHPKVHQVAASDEDVTVPAHDVVFVGTGFQDRVDLLGAVDWSGIDFGLYGAWASLPSRHPLRRHLRGNEQPNTTTAQLYRRATVGLNLHRRAQSFGKRTRYIVRAESMNPRCYELAACGLPFVTDARAEVADVFGDSVWTFTDADDLGAKVRELLGNPAARAACVEGARRAVASHHWLNRAQWVLAALKAPANLARTA
jgi:spore maturation protein CgeB